MKRKVLEPTGKLVTQCKFLSYRITISEKEGKYIIEMYKWECGYKPKEYRMYYADGHSIPELIDGLERALSHFSSSTHFKAGLKKSINFLKKSC